MIIQQLCAQFWTHGCGQAQAGIARERFECGLWRWDRVRVVFAGARFVCGAWVGACATAAIYYFMRQSFFLTGCLLSETLLILGTIHKLRNAMRVVSIVAFYFISCSFSYNGECF